MKEELRYGPLWFGLWLGMLALVVVLSLGSPPPSPDVPFADKWQHFLTYGVLAAAAVQVFRRDRALLVAAVALVLVGVLLELGQGTLTADRMMDWRDAVANTTGVLLGAATAMTPLRHALASLRWS